MERSQATVAGVANRTIYILTLSLNLILGYTGLPAFGHAAFSCVGAYTSSLLALQYGISPWIGLTLGACVAAVLGLLIGLPSIRLKGDYLALATFGLGVIVYSVAKNWVSLTRGPLGLSGIPGFTFFGFPWIPSSPQGWGGDCVGRQWQQSFKE